MLIAGGLIFPGYLTRSLVRNRREPAPGLDMLGSDDLRLAMLGQSGPAGGFFDSNGVYSW